MTQLPTVLTDFQKDAGRVEHLLRLVKSFRDFAGADVPEAVGDGTVAWPEAQALADVAPVVRTDLPIVSGSILLYLCGRFESFVRDLVGMLADDLASEASQYTDLPPIVRSELLARTLDVVQTPQRYGYKPKEAEALLLGLAANLSGGSGVGAITIESKVLTTTEANMGSRMVADLFKRVGIGDLWRDIGKQAPLKTHLGVATDGECVAEAQSRLDQMMKDRNKIAHPVGETTFPDPDQVLDAAAFMTALASVLLDLALVPRPPMPPPPSPSSKP